MDLRGKKIVLGITGSIAAYKSILLIRLLTKAGAEVRVILTPAAKDFVSSLVLSTLSKNEVYIDLAQADTWANHVMLGRWADLLIVVPASCNTLAKMAHGLCDNLLLAVILSATCAVWVAPAMDEDMWNHPATRQNLQILQKQGVHILPVGSGALASGLEGPGRVAEPEEILAWIKQFLGNQATKPLQGKKALVTAGPTYEPIDPVRFIGNHSSGLMGIEVAAALHKAGADVTLILGPSKLPVPAGIAVTRVTTAQQMFDASTTLFPQCQIAVMAAAVADYRPANPAMEKIKKADTALTIQLVPNPDILKYCGHHKQPGQLVVGFALETENEEQYALGKMAAKKADMIVLNSLRDEQAGFGTPTNKITIFESNGAMHALPLLDKAEAAAHIVKRIAAFYEPNNG